MGTPAKPIIVFTGSFRGRRLIAEKIARWLEAPSLFMDSILKGLRPHINDDNILVTEGVFEGLLPAAGEEEVSNKLQLARIALRIVFGQLPHLAQTMNSQLGSIVLELPWCSPIMVEILMTFIQDHHQNKLVLDRGLIIECEPREEVSGTVVRWHQFEEEMRNPEVIFWHNKNNKTTWGDIEKAIEQQLQLMSSKFEKLKSLRCGREFKDRVVSRLEMDPSLHFDFVRDLPRIREDRITGLSTFHRAISHLAFNTDIGLPAFISMRQWGEFLRNNIPIKRSKLGPCFKGESRHEIVYTSTTQLHNNERVNDNIQLFADQCCRLCEGELVNEVDSSYYSCLFCLLNMHKACAESLDVSAPALLCPAAAAAAYNEWTSLLEQQDKTRVTVCPSCKEYGIDFSPNCRACVFDTFLKCRLLPIIVPYPFHVQQQQREHDFLVARTGRQKRTDKFCAACGDWIRVSSSIYYIHRRESLHYGFACIALLPHKIRHTHFGYHHSLKLLDKPYQELDNYICDVCWQERDPFYWHYYCNECDFAAHIYCIRNRDDHHH